MYVLLSCPYYRYFSGQLYRPRVSYQYWVFGKQSQSSIGVLQCAINDTNEKEFNQVRTFASDASPAETARIGSISPAH